MESLHAPSYEHGPRCRTTRKRNEALRLVRERRYDEAIPTLRRAAQEVSVADDEYDAWLVALARALKATGAHAAAGHVHLYLLDFDAAHAEFAAANRPLERALCCERRGAYQEAASLYESQRWYAHAASALERVSPAEALSLWRRRLAELDGAVFPYAKSLAMLNLAFGLKAAGEEEGARRRALIEALSGLEGLACEYEQQGLIDEALDCYHMTIQIGQEQRAFENMSEGYINAIRLLTERGRALTALRYYAGISKEGRAWGEHHAVATLLQEAADLVQRSGMLYGDHYIEQAGEAWLEVVEQNAARGVPAELTENALLAALDCFNRLDDGDRVQRCYEALANLELEESRRGRYARLHEVSRGERRQRREWQPPSELLLRPPRLLPLWREELLMWEAGEDTTRLVSRAVWDLVYHDTVRRRALNLMLASLDGDAGAAVQRETARALAYMPARQALRGLRRLQGSADPELRASVMRAAAEMDHPGALALIEEGLKDIDESVRRAALEGIGGHHRAEDFDALRRLLERMDDDEVRRRVIAAIGRIRTFEVAEYLYRLLLAGGAASVVDAAQTALRQVLSSDWARVLRNRASSESEEAKARLRLLWE